MVGGLLADRSGRRQEEGLVSLRKARLQLTQPGPPTSLLPEGPVSELPSSWYQAGSLETGPRPCALP